MIASGGSQIRRAGDVQSGRKNHHGLGVDIGIGYWRLCVVGSQSEPVSVRHHHPRSQGIGHLLLPDLDNAVVTVIDRPHYPEENMDEERKKEIKRLRVFNVSTNSIGLRGPELEDPKPEIRIACVGDSVTFGWGVSYEESYPARLERLLIERGRSVRVERRCASHEAWNHLDMGH